jgi:hypothetical protein
VAINCPIKKTQYDSMIYGSVREMNWLPWARAYNGARHDECPPTGSGIGLDGLEHSHVMFDLLGIDGTRSVVVGLVADMIVERSALGGGVGLDLMRYGRLLCEVVVHVDDLWEKGEGG